MKYFKITILTLALIFFSLLKQNALAQTFRSFSVSPPTIEQKIDPGSSVQGKITLFNNGSESLSFKSFVRDFVVEDTNGTPVMLNSNENNDKFSASSWITFNPNSFTIPSHGQQNITYYIKVPQEARPGGHYASILFQPENNLGTIKPSAEVSAQVGSLFYIDVSGKIVENATAEFLNTRSLYEYGPLNILSRIKNNGDLHINPASKVEVFDMIGRKIQISELESTNIFPGASRDFENKIGSKFMIGRYKISLTGVYGQNNNELTAVAYFWVFPWKIVLAIILSVIAAGLLIIVFKNKSSKSSGGDNLGTNKPEPQA